MYEALISHLRECAKYDKSENTFKEAADAMEELTREYESIAASLTESVELVRKLQRPRWIPVTESLPPAEKEVYVTDGEYIARANLLDEVFPGDKPCWSYSGLGEITHWCEQIPLPQLPKEE